MAQQRQSSNISRGSSLTPTKTSSWLSSSGLYAFGFYQRGNGGYAVGVFLAGIPEKTVVWTARRDDPPVSANATLLFNDAEGRLVLQTAQSGQEDTTYIVDIAQTASYASMLDTGNFVLYNSDGDILWQSFKYPTDTLLPTQTLSAGMELFSSVSETVQSTGFFRLKMQSDGNLVQYPKNTADTAPYAYWASSTDGTGDKVTLNLDVDGNLYLLNATSFKLKNLTSGVYTTRGTILMMRIDSDGLFRLYSHSLGNSSRWSIVWNSTGDRCEPKGLCGLNSFCISNDLTPGCRCLPGFASVNQDNKTSGCERNFTAESCKSKGKKYTLKELDNTIWLDVSYSVLSQTSKEDCSQACLVDCNCEAALFKNGVCRKQGLPLRYGRRAGDSNIALIKVEETSESSTDGILPTREGKKEISKNIIIIIISCLFVSLILVIVAIFGIILHRYHVSAYKRIPYNGDIGFCGDIAPRSFSYAELERMTDDFREEIGRGSSGTVYKGTVMNDGEKYDAGIKKIKHLKPLPQQLLQSLNEELDFLGQEIPPSVATAIAEGRLDPVSMEAFNCFPRSGYHQDPVAVQTSSRPQKPEITIVSGEETGFIVFSSRKTTENEITGNHSRRRKFNGSHLDQGESISNQVSVVIETEDSNSEKAMESQESVDSKPKRVSKGKERKTIEKKKTIVMARIL
ncbi:hypothetical protein LWI29_006464 [Acer saccharum]|uniref:Bulb-type lectin domain-containing protein n=1 Tax=Acer saccharum TaxID=4024 RepID=A0AA39SCP0_ACESA|nr:hypothetical protein LWI29_006464 [Acer saccharum]